MISKLYLLAKIFQYSGYIEEPSGHIKYVKTYSLVSLFEEKMEELVSVYIWNRNNRNEETNIFLNEDLFDFRRSSIYTFKNYSFLFRFIPYLSDP